jgi:gluconokinase
VSYFLGIDIGTTHTKAVLLTGDGKPFFEAKKSYDLLHPQPGYEEQDTLIIFDAVVDLIKQSIQAGSHNIAAVSFSAAMHSILPVDKEGRPLYNSIIWADTRSKKEAEAIAASKDASAIYNNTGIPFHPMSPLCKILWFKNQLPGVFAKTARFISIKEFVFLRLFGKYIVDYSIASATGLFNSTDRKWDTLALKAAGIDEIKLSDPVSTVHAEYELLPFYKELFSIKDNIPFIAGSSDGCLANLGSGAVDHGQIALTIGTSGAVRMTVNEFIPANSGMLFTYPLTDDIFVQGGAINNGGIVLKWLADLFLTPGETDYGALLSIASGVRPGANGLLFLPYLLGERAPIWDADAKGALVGLTLKHKREHIVRAAIEGICFTLYQIIQKLEAVHGPVVDIRVSGGFVRSSFWVQLIADITGKKIKVSETTDASAIGAAYLAMYAMKFIKNLSDTKQFNEVCKVYEPDPAGKETYAELFQLFNSLYPKIKEDFAVLSRLQEN